MPIIAVAVAAISIGSVGAAGFGAILAGTASIGTMFAGVAAVGATLGAIGAVTGVKELQTAGMVIGGIGGVGAIANAVGAFGANATMGTVFGGAEAAAASQAGTQAGGLINGAMESTNMANDMVSGFTANGINSATGIVDTANGIGGFTDVAKAMGGDGLSNVVTPKALEVVKGAAGAVDAAKGLSTDIVEGPTSADNTGAPEMPTKNGVQDPAATVTGKVTSASADGNGIFGKNGFFNTMGGMGVVQAAGSFLSGAFDEVKPAQAEAYKAQAAANNAAAALQNKQNSNMNEPIPVARRMAVTGKLGGMINSTPPAGAMA